MTAAPGSPARREVDVGNAGTVMRFLPPVAALADGDVTLRRRPAGPASGRSPPSCRALRALGADVSADHGPAAAHGARPRLAARREVVIDASASSQFVSALLLAAPRFADAVEVRHSGGRLPSGAHIDMTVEMLRAAGAIVEHVDDQPGGSSPARCTLGRLHVEPDLSNAAPFLAAAVVTGGAVTVPGWPLRTTQAGDALRDLLPRFGATVELHDEGLTVTGPGRLEGVDLDLRRRRRARPGARRRRARWRRDPSRLRGIAHLRLHETDRLAALASEITALGGDVRETDDGLDIRPRPLHGGDVRDVRRPPAGDQAARCSGCCVPGVEVDDVATTAKTLPDFVELWTGMLGDGRT